MNAKRTLVSFLAIATLLFLATSVSAATLPPLTEGDIDVEINGIDVEPIPPESGISVVAGDEITVKVTFTVADLNIEGNGDATPDRSELIRIKAKLGDANVKTAYFTVEGGMVVSKTFTLVVPNELEDELSDDMTLSLEIGNSDFKSESDIILRVQRESFQVAVNSVIMSSSLTAGETSLVEVVLENTGYNNLEDLYVTVRIAELGVEKTAYFGDLGLELGGDNEDSVKVYLEVPYSVASGIYTLEVEVANEDFSEVVERQVSVTNGFPEVVLKTGSNLLVLNPTNSLKVYKIVYPSEELTIAVEAGSSKLLPVEFPEEEEYNFDVFVFDGEELAGTVNFTGVSESEGMSSPVFVLTLILAVIFVVLLVVMIVLITKKPEKAEEFGESYY